MLKSCAAKRTPKDVFITTWPKVVWNGAQGLGSRLLKLRTYHQPTAGHKDASTAQSATRLLDRKR